VAVADWIFTQFVVVLTAFTALLLWLTRLDRRS
jgi:hypothetical protein